MPFVEGILCNPATQQINFSGRELLPTVDRWHPRVGILAQNTGHQFTGVRVAWHNGGVPLTTQQRRLPNIQPQIGLPIPLVRSVAGEALIGQNLPHVAVKADMSLVGDSRACQKQS